MRDGDLFTADVHAANVNVTSLAHSTHEVSLSATDVEQVQIASLGEEWGDIAPEYERRRAAVPDTGMRRRIGRVQPLSHHIVEPVTIHTASLAK